MEKLQYFDKANYVLWKIYWQYCELFVALFYCTKFLYILLEVLLNFSRKFSLPAKKIHTYIYLLSHGIVSALENKELICHFRVYGKSAKSAQTGGQISINGSFKKSL